MTINKARRNEENNRKTDENKLTVQKVIRTVGKKKDISEVVNKEDYR